jgi:hypothetical protein
LVSVNESEAISDEIDEQVEIASTRGPEDLMPGEQTKPGCLLILLKDHDAPDRGLAVPRRSMRRIVHGGVTRWALP